jgi:hypothetical protein
MATQVQFRRGTTVDISTFIGADGEVVVDTTKKTCVVNDGVQIAGYPLLREDGSNSALSVGSLSSCALKFVNDPNTGIISPGTDQIALVTGGASRLSVDSSGSVTIPGNLLVAGSVTGSITFDNGSAAVPALRFTNDPDTGIYLAGTNELAISTGGTQRLTTTTTAVTSTLPVIHPLGAAATPSLTFTGDTNTGIYSPGADQVAVATNGTGRLFVDASGRIIIGASTAAIGNPLEIVGNPSGLALGVRGRSADNVGSIGFYPNNSSTEYARIQSNGDSSLSFGTGSSGTERLRVTSSGRLLVGTSSGRNVCTVYQSNIQIETTQYAGLSIVNNTADTGPALLSLAKSRGASVDAVNLVQPNDNLGAIAFGGADGTNVETVAAEITCAVDGTPGANDMPGRLVFSTTADGASSPTERLRITSAGLVGVGTSAPNYQLHVTTDFAVGASGFNQQLTFSNDTIQSLLLGTGYTALKLNPLGGNVGIGTSSVSDKLEIANGTTDAANALGIRSGRYLNASQEGAQLKYYSDNTSSWLGTREVARISACGLNSDHRIGSLAFALKTTNSASDPTEMMRLTPTGLGIGTTGPSSPLTIESSAGNQVKITYPSIASYFLNATSGGDFAINKDGTERVRIDSSGRLLVGTSSASATSTAVFASRSDAADAPLVAFYTTESTVTDGANFGTLSFGNTATSGTNAGAFIQAQRDGGTWTNNSSMPGRLVFSTTADGASTPTERMRITSAGLVGIGTSSPVATNHIRGSGTSGQVTASWMLENTSSGSVGMDVTGAAGSSIWRFLYANGPLTGTNAFTPALTIGVEGAAAGNVGIGTTSPNSVLQVNSGTNLGGILVGFNAGSSNFYDADLQVFRTGNGTERARITSAGLVGIGTSSPQAVLESKTASVQPGDAAYAKKSVVANIPYSTSNITSSALAVYDGTIHAADIGYSYDGSGYYLALGTSLNTVSAPTERVRIDRLGNVGIGTTSPSAILHVSSDDFIKLTRNAKDLTVNANYSAGDDKAQIQTDGGMSLAFATNGDNERARIDSSGRLLVGTSSGSGNNLLQVQGESGSSAGIGGIVLRRGLAPSLLSSGSIMGRIDFGPNDGGVGASIVGEGDAQQGTSDYPSRLVFSTTADGASSPTERMRITKEGASRFFCSTGADAIDVSSAEAAGTSRYLFLGAHSATGTGTGTNCYRVYTNGNVENTNNSYGAISDIKLKENIVDASPQWDDLKALQVRNYNFKEGQTHTQIGLVAQEVELVSPGLVSESPDRDAEGNDLGTVTKSVNYSVLYMKAVKALQEAMERIEALEADVAQLKGA